MKRIWDRLNQLPYYVKAVLLATPFVSALLIYLLSIGAADLLSDWFIALISIPTFFANQIATSAYFGNIIDMFRQLNTDEPRRYKEFAGTLLGLCIGIAVGVGLSVMHVAVPLVSSLYAFANVLFTFRQINIFAGIGNRVGRCADKNSRPMSEKALVASAGLLGLTLGIILFATCTAAMISVVGITSFFSGGAAIPAWIAGIIFVMSVSSGLASSADYTAKGISFIRAPFISKGRVKDTVEKRPFEYGGSLVGVILGLIIGGVIVGAIAIVNPPLLVGIVGVIAGLLIMTTSAGIIGSIFSRGGRVIDAYQQSNESIPTKSISISPPLCQLLRGAQKNPESPPSVYSEKTAPNNRMIRGSLWYRFWRPFKIKEHQEVPVMTNANQL